MTNLNSPLDPFRNKATGSCIEDVSIPWWIMGLNLILAILMIFRGV
jgi:hypothetical protein